MRLDQFKKKLQKVQREINTTVTYLRLAMGGNHVERITNFKACNHPVLLLYGFGATRRVFSILEKRLRKDGFCVFSINLGGIFSTFNTHCIEELAEFVDHKIERLCKRYNLKRMSIVGHSKGGLIGRYYIKRLDGSKRVKALITLGTPHHGNPLALLGLATPLGIFSKSLWQMYPMSPFIRKLKKGTWPKNVRLVSIYSKTDRICFYKSAMLDNEKDQDNIKNIELPNMTHSDYILRRSAYNVIKKELLAGEHS